MAEHGTPAHGVDEHVTATARLDHALLLLADARLPTGAHAVSGGLEAALLVGGLTASDIADYLRTRLLTAVPVDAGVAVLARRAVVTAAPSASLPRSPAPAPSMAGEEALRLADAWAARTPSPAVRDAARLAGRGLHRLVRRLHPDDAGSAWLAPLVQEGLAWRPLVLGALAADLGLDDRRTALALAYDEVASVTSAALKLLPLDPLAAVDWSIGAADDLAAAVDVATRIATINDVAACAAPQLETWQQRHATHDRRLFHA